MNDEILEIVNENGQVTGSASREMIHNDNTLLHRVVHLLLFNSRGKLLLQKRSMSKDVAPGKWDTSVGGHAHPGETIQEALTREMMEELLLTSLNTTLLYTYIHRNERESEFVSSFTSIYDGSISFNKDEISEIRFWDTKTILEHLKTDIFSNNFKDEFRRYMKFIEDNK